MNVTLPKAVSVTLATIHFVIAAFGHVLHDHHGCQGEQCRTVAAAVADCGSCVYHHHDRDCQVPFSAPSAPASVQDERTATTVLDATAQTSLPGHDAVSCAACLAISQLKHGSASDHAPMVASVNVAASVADYDSLGPLPVRRASAARAPPAAFSI